MFGHLLEHAIGVGLAAVDLVDRHHDRHFGRLGVIDGLDRLRHHAVVRCYHQDDDVGRLRTTGAHGGEGLVARRVDERDLVAVVFDLVGTDVLRDAAGFARDHVGVADTVEELGLAVVDVAHHRHDGRARWTCLVLFVARLGRHGEHALEFDLLFLTRLDELDLCADLGGEQFEHVVGQRLCRRDHLALLQQVAHDIGRGAVELGTDVLRGRQALDDDHALRNGRVGRAVGRQVERLELFAHPATTALAPWLLMLTTGAATGRTGTAPGGSGTGAWTTATRRRRTVEARRARTTGATAGTTGATRAAGSTAGAGPGAVGAAGDGRARRWRGPTRATHASARRGWDGTAGVRAARGRRDRPARGRKRRRRARGRRDVGATLAGARTRFGTRTGRGRRWSLLLGRARDCRPGADRRGQCCESAASPVVPAGRRVAWSAPPERMTRVGVGADFGFGRDLGASVRSRRLVLLRSAPRRPRAREERLRPGAGRARSATRAS